MQINYEKIIETYPWIIERGQNCILSPDSDGFLCGLLMTSYLNFNVVGYYDGKILILKNGLNASDCIFIDVDINRNNCKSIGHHIVTYNKNIVAPNHNYSNCIQPNIFRDFDGKNDFQRKYPFGTIHLLMSILKTAEIITSIPEKAEWPLLFTDGAWNNLFGYTENCIDWINYLKIADTYNILNPVFCSSDKSFYDIMVGLNDFLRMRDNFNAEGYYDGNAYQSGGRNRRTGDKLKISNSHGEIINLVKNNGLYKIHDKEKDRIENFIKSMSTYIEFDFISEKWEWDSFKLFKFSKSDFSNHKLNNGTYLAMMHKNPLSLAMTSSQNIEYTLEYPDQSS